MAEKPKKSPVRLILILVGGSIIFLCIFGLILSTFFPSEETPIPPTEVAEDTEVPIVDEEEVVIGEPTSTSSPEATNTSAPTNTPQPTNTPIPTSTPDPNFIRRGTHIVNVDIEPGIYRGVAGIGILASCYWERLEDLSGEFGAIIANENAQGQFYVEVTDDDFAFHVACDMQRLDPMPEPPEEYPDEIDVGMYLVGIDIQPGLYQGLAGDDITTSCYWQRMRNVEGDFESIIANDNATGQFYIQVSASDFALQTACPLTRIGD
jgi:hypothetical protein